MSKINALMHRSLFILFFNLSLICFSQNFTISGYLEDAESGEKLIGANVIDKRTQSGTTTNNFGFFSCNCLWIIY